jgi:hypothetical protein
VRTQSPKNGPWTCERPLVQEPGDTIVLVRGVRAARTSNRKLITLLVPRAGP